MITIVEYRDGDETYDMHTAFSGTDSALAKEHFEDALETSVYASQWPYIALTVYSDDGKTFIDHSVFKTVISALEWWEEHHD